MHCQRWLSASRFQLTLRNAEGPKAGVMHCRLSVWPRTTVLGSSVGMRAMQGEVSHRPLCAIRLAACNWAKPEPAYHSSRGSRGRECALCGCSTRRMSWNVFRFDGNDRYVRWDACYFRHSLLVCWNQEGFFSWFVFIAISPSPVDNPGKRNDGC